VTRRLILADGTVGAITGITGTVTGILALLISALSLRRSVIADRKARKVVFAQKKLEILTLLSAGEAAVISTRRKLMAIGDEVLELKDLELIEQYKDQLNFYEDSQTRLAKMREGCKTLEVTKPPYEEIIEAFDNWLGELSLLSDPASIEVRGDEFIQMMQMRMRWRKQERDKELS
jgi:hypothetical protein